MSPAGESTQEEGVQGSERGMTILEVLIAFNVLAVVALAVFASFGIGLRAAALAGSMQTGNEPSRSLCNLDSVSKSIRLASLSKKTSNN